jgi:hypothetical protein
VSSHGFLLSSWQRSRRAAAGGRRKGSDGARGYALLAMPEGMLITDIVVAHPAAQSYLDAAARIDGAAAVDREAFKVQKYRESADTGAYAFEAMGVETYGRLGAGTMRLINRTRGDRGVVGQGGQGRVRRVNAAGDERGVGALQRHALQGRAQGDGACDGEDVPGRATRALRGLILIVHRCD